MHKQSSIRRIEYRNATFHGSLLKSSVRQGFGLLLRDNSDILLAQWQNDQVSGPYVFFSQKLRAYGTMKNNKLQGFNVICTSSSPVQRQSNSGQTIFSLFKENKMYGSCIFLREEGAFVGEFLNGQLQAPFAPVQSSNLQKILKQTFPRNIFELTHFMKELQSQAITRAQQMNKINKYMPLLLKIDENTFFYGYGQQNRDKKFGFVIREHQILTIGQYQNLKLQGLGRAYRNEGIVEDGVFREDELKGIGVRYWKSSNKHVFGDFEENQTINKGYSWPQNLINQFRSEFHLRSLYFHSNQVSLTFPKLMFSLFELAEKQKQHSLYNSQSNYFSTRGLQNRGRNLTTTQKYEDSLLLKEKSRQKSKMLTPNQNLNFTTIEQSSLEEEENPKKLDLLRKYREEDSRKRNRTWYIKK